MVDGTVIQEVGRNNLLDDLLKDLLAEVKSRDLLSMLSRDDDSINAKGDSSTTILLILDGDLGLRVRSKPGKSFIAARNSHGCIKLMRKHDSERHQLLRLVRRVSKHDTLVTRPMVLQRAMIEPLRDVWGLLLDGNEDVTGFVIKTLGRIVVANLLDSLADDLLVIKLGFGGDLAKDHDHASFSSGLTSDLRPGVLSKTCIQL